ncbi:cytochrome c biogenesis CcdA family protein [Chloroflexota bacterium]
MEIGSIGYLGAFAAGVLSFLSPCVFPLITAYLAQLTGMSFNELQNIQSLDQRRTLLKNAFAFVFGLALVFTLFGASATLLGRFLARNQDLIERIAGGIIVVFGLHLAGVIQIPWLMREVRADLTEARRRSPGAVGSMLMGSAFGIGWTPCIGSVLASILAIASQAETVPLGMGLLLAYALGLGLPFIGMAYALNQATGRAAIAGIRGWMPALTISSGALLIIMGLLVFTGNLITLSNWITQTFGVGLTL